MKIKIGKYRHFKGGLYQVIGSSIHTETDEEFVIYYPLYKSNKFSSEVWCARPAKMFNEDVEVDGKKV